MLKIELKRSNSAVNFHYQLIGNDGLKMNDIIYYVPHETIQ